MAETLAEIPDRDWFKPSEVCEIASVQPYVLRSWEIEFPNLGVQRSGGTSRLYRRTDVERVLRIRQLVFGEGLTLAGARRRIEGDPPVGDADEPALVGAVTREKLAAIRQELKALHEWLSADRPASDGRKGARAEQPELPEIAGNGNEGASEPWPPKRQTRRKARKS